MTHGFNKWIITVNDTVDSRVYRIVDTLEGGFPIGIVPGLIRSGDPFDYRPDKVGVKFLLVRWRDAPDFSRINNLLL